MRTFRLIFFFILAAAAVGCPPIDGAKLYQTQDKAPSLDPGAIENLDHLGPTIVDKGVNFGVYSEHAERIEILLFDDPDTDRPTRQFPLKRFGDVWNLYVEGIGEGQHYGFIAWGPNWPYDPKFLPGSITGFKADVDRLGNRFNPNKLLFDPYGKALHRDHDWSKGSLASGPKRTESTWAAASKSVVVKSKYVWSENESAFRKKRQIGEYPGHRWNDLILYELHPKGFTASAASGVLNPGTYKGLGDKAPYLKDLGITAVHIMPPFEKPSDGGYWGYNSLSFFTAERTFASKSRREEVIDEFKGMVDAFHQNDIEVLLDVVYNHTGEGGFWRYKRVDAEPDKETAGALKNFEDKEVAGLYSYRGLDNIAYYALAQDPQYYVANSGVGNDTRANHRPMRRLILDSLRYWVDEMHVDGFRFDLAPLLRARDGEYNVIEDSKNTVVQDVIDDPVLQKYHTRIIAEPWAYSAYLMGNFPSASNKAGTAWGEWNGPFRDWWRSFFNIDDFPFNKVDTTNGQGGGFFLTGSFDWFNWNQRKPYHSTNFITVHDGFTMYDLLSFGSVQNQCGPLNPVCCDDPSNSFCDPELDKIPKTQWENRSRNWGPEGEPMKRQIIRNFFTVMLISHGTPLLYQGDEWLRTQLGNSNAYGTLADNEYNWMDWGVYEAQDHRQRMHDFVKQMIRFRKDHQYALAPLEYGQGAPFQWKSPEGGPARWSSKQMMLHYDDPTKGPELAIAINGETSEVTFTLPPGRTWKRVVDTQSYWDLPETLQTLSKPPRVSNNVWLEGAETALGTYVAKPRSIVIFEAH